MPNGWRTIKSLVHKIRLHGRRGKGMAEPFSREKLRHAPQKEGGWEILCDPPPVWPRLVRPTNFMADGWRLMAGNRNWLMADGWWPMVDGWWLMADGLWLTADGWWLETEIGNWVRILAAVTRTGILTHTMPNTWRAANLSWVHKIRPQRRRGKGGLNPFRDKN